MDKQYKVGVVGATGMVGQRFVTLLENHPWFKLTVLAASGGSAGKSYEDAVGSRWAMTTPMPESVKKMTVLDASKVEEVASQVDFVFCAVNMPKDEIKALEEAYAKAECPVVSNNSANRFTPDVPMVVPEINAGDVKLHHGIISNPNCSTIITLTAINALRKLSPIRDMVVSTYQAVSGAGAGGPIELQNEVDALRAGKTYAPKVFAHQIAYNVIPQIGGEQCDGYTSEEMKLQNEGRKILHLPDMNVACTCVRVPVFYGHSESVNIETERKLSAKEARAILAQAPGVQVYDNPSEKMYPLAIDAAGEDQTYVGRIREDETIPNGLNLWIVADNIRKGAALNAVQIAEELLRRDLLGVKDRTVFIKK